MTIPQRVDPMGSKRRRQSWIMLMAISSISLFILATLLLLSSGPNSHHHHYSMGRGGGGGGNTHLLNNIVSRLSSTSSSSSSSPPPPPPSSASANSAKKKKTKLCSSTNYPDVCMQSLNGSSSTANSRGLVSLAAKYALKHVNSAFNLSSKLAKQKGGNPMETAALQDCHELMDDARDQLALSISALSSLTNSTSSPSLLEKQLQEIRIQLSSSLSLQTVCSDGCSTYHPGSRSKLLLAEQDTLSKLIVNCLGLAKSLRNSTQQSSVNSRRRRLLVDGSEDKEERLVFSLGKNGYPEWLSSKDRKLLQAPASSVSANVVVAQDGTGQYTTLQGAVDNIPKSYSGRYVIYIKEGVYQENVTIAKKYKNLMLLGDGINRTIITGNRNVALQNYTTFRSATVAVSSPGFMAKGVTFQNTAGPEGHQAVAMRVNGDFTVFESCSFEGYQDTLYALASRQFYRDCDIYGTVDYIFGNAIAVFQNCNLYARRPLKGQQNTYTAQGRTVADDPSGYSFQNCSLLPADDLTNSSYSVTTYLGRPWKEYSRTVFLRSYMGNLINTAGWLAWNSSNPYIDTLYYGEYENTGPRSDVAQRVTWSGVHSNMSFDEAYMFSPDNFISASTWLPDAGVTYQELS